MKSSKAIILSLAVFLILSTIIIAKNQIISLATKYLPPQVKAVIKLMISQNDGNQRLSNDYNDKFLPETQFIKLNFKRLKFDFFSDAEVGYYQKLKKSNLAYKSFYIDIFDSSSLIITDTFGNSYIIEDLKDKSFSQDKLKPIKNNIRPTKVLDTYIYKNEIFISYIDTRNNCRNFVISKAKINQKDLNYKEFFRDKLCANFIQGGRMQTVVLENNLGLIFSVADNVTDEPRDDPQNDSSNFGKLMFKEFNSGKTQVYSKGHRNPQGLIVFDSTILSTEHGPRGGDEINKIEYKINYGWPISSYGKPYSTKNNYEQSHNKNNFKEPIFSFTPSIGIGEIIKLPNSFNKSWQDNFIVASLNKRSLFRIKFDSQYSKIIYFEEIYIGQRIRDIKFYKNNILLALEGKGELGILSNHE